MAQSADDIMACWLDMGKGNVGFFAVTGAARAAEPCFGRMIMPDVYLPATADNSLADDTVDDLTADVSSLIVK